MSARTNYILVDYESVQPKDIDLLRGGPFEITVFLGPHQTKIPRDFANSMQGLGDNASYVFLETAGKNALDFHIAYYVGVLSSEDPNGFFHIISRDGGFEPLIKHLKSKKIFAQRSTCIADIPCFKPALPATREAQIELAVADLVRRKDKAPKRRRTLLSTLGSVFKNELPEEQLLQLLNSLCSRGVVRLEGEKVSYELPLPSTNG